MKNLARYLLTGILGGVLIVSIASCGGGGSSAEVPAGLVRISGVVSDDIIVGATVTVTALDSTRVLGTATTGADGSYSITVPSAALASGYLLRSVGGTMNGLPFSGNMSAMYPPGWDPGASNVTLLTSALNSAANSTNQYAGSLLQRQEAIRTDAILRGVLTSDYFEVEPTGQQTAALRVQARNDGVDAMIAAFGDILGNPMVPVTCSPSRSSCTLDVGDSGELHTMTLQGGSVTIPARTLFNCRVFADFDSANQRMNVRIEGIVPRSADSSTAPVVAPVVPCQAEGKLTITLNPSSIQAPDECLSASQLASSMPNCVTSEAGINPSYFVMDGKTNHRIDRPVHLSAAVLGKSVRISRNYGAGLYSSIPSSGESSNPLNQWIGKKAVIFVHGYTLTGGSGSAGVFGGNDDTWGMLPNLVAQDSSRVVLNFQWRTDSSYLAVANELAKVVDYAEMSTGSKVDIVSHSFGGVLSRVMLQNLNGSTSEAALKVARLVTVGTPHSGILKAVDGATSTRSVERVELPRGWGSVLLDSNCGQITCYQSGLSADLADWVKDDYLALDFDPDFPGLPEPGYITARLAKTLSSLPADLKILTLIGQRPDGFAFNENDGLIAYLGQRFIPQVGRIPLLQNTRIGGGDVTERVLGLQPGVMGFPGDSISGISASQYASFGGFFVGYKHSDFNLSNTGGARAEVNVPGDCSNAATCMHDTWVNIQEFWATHPAPSGGGNLPHTGITASQCYEAGSDVLVACNSPGALALNSQQDGHRVNVSPMSYRKVGFNGEFLASSASSWCAVRDEVTGLMWQNHQSTPATFTNWGDNRAGDASRYAADNATLCGLAGWRLPTVDELQTIVDYRDYYSNINTTWFPDTLRSEYWSSSPSATPGDGGNAWYVGYDGGVNLYDRNRNVALRLVRASQ